MSARLLIFIAIILLASPAGALVLASGEGSRNTTAPADDFGFANVGKTRESVVYLGSGWVITANHVSVGPVVLDGDSYVLLPQSKVRIRNPRARVSPDLAMFRLQAVPDLPSLPIRATPPEVGQIVFLAGNGYGRGAAVEYQERFGWSWSDEQDLRWGTNTVRAIGLTITVRQGNATSAFDTDFSANPATEHEAQVAVGDSGGGAFIKRGDTWELAGVLFASDHDAGQTQRTAIQGNLTLIADLSVYRDQILAVIACDDDRDCIDARRARAPSSCGEGFAWSLVAPLLVRRRWPSWAPLRRRRREPS